MMDGWQVDLAEPEDDASIRALLAGSTLPGWISMSYRSSPGAHGMLHPHAIRETLVARREGDLAGMVSRARFPGFLHGSQAILSYLGHFRAAPNAARRTRLLRGAFDACRDQFGGEPSWSFASLLDGNATAHRLLTSGLAGFPRLSAVGRLQTLVFRSLRPKDVPDTRQAQPLDMGEVVEFHKMRARPLAPVLDAEDLLGGRWPGVSTSDFILAEQGGRLLGFCALWDQRRFRQLRVTGYRQPLSALRQVINLAGPVTGFPRLPPPGEDLRMGYLSFLTVRPGDRATALRLVQAARRLAGQRGLDSVALGLAEDDPCLAPVRTAMRAASYGSCIYTLAWQDDARPPPADFADMQPEIGLL